jgi:hypothetical protein
MVRGAISLAPAQGTVYAGSVCCACILTEAVVRISRSIFSFSILGASMFEGLFQLRPMEAMFQLCIGKCSGDILWALGEMGPIERRSLTELRSGCGALNALLIGK